MFKVNIITACPEMFPGVLGHSIIGNALKEKKWSLKVVNLHDFGYDKRNSIDDIPFGGGPGMIIRADVVEKAFKSLKIKPSPNNMLLYMSPSGKTLKQSDLRRFSKIDEITILCGKFEGIDARAIDALGFQQISIGDYVVTGGDVAAQVLVEGCIRLIPGVLGHPESILEDSFSSDFLEYPQYTRPKVWIDTKKNKHNVPDILLSGHHDKIKEWRKKKSFEITQKNRPDLLKKKFKETKK